MQLVKKLTQHFARRKLQRALYKILTKEQRQAQKKLAQQWHWGDTGQCELAVIDNVQSWLLPLPKVLDALTYFRRVEQNFNRQLQALCNTDPDGYAISTNKQLAKAVLAVISEFGRTQTEFGASLAVGH